jgi:uncharacterized membrane protein required for colicin V production
MSIILDTGILIIILLSIFVCFRRGLIKSLLGVVSNVASIFISTYLGSLLTTFIYDSFIKENIISSISSSIAENVSSSSQSVESATNNLPDYVNTILGLFGYTTDSLNQGVTTAIESQSLGVAQAIESVLQPIVTAIIGFLLVIVLFIIIRLILRKLIRMIDKVAKLPVLNTVNKLLGGLLGIVDGFVIAYFAVAITAILLPLITGGSIAGDTLKSFAEDSYIFGFFYNDNIIINMLMG